MKRIIYWKDGEVRFEDKWGGHLQGCFCIDTIADASRPADRYGIWKHTWVEAPLQDFPAEFRTHLLLLGVS